MNDIRDQLSEISEDTVPEAANILNRANERAEEILKDAEEKLRKSKSDKFNAVAEFNKSYGPYKTVLTKEAAEKEYNRFISDIDNWLNKLNRFF